MKRGLYTITPVPIACHETRTSEYWKTAAKFLGVFTAICLLIAGIFIGIFEGISAGKHKSEAHDIPANQSAHAKVSYKVSTYWGGLGSQTGISLADVCSDPSYDIVNLAFLTSFNVRNEFPTMKIGSLNGSSFAQQSAGATSLQDGSPLIPAIELCQKKGKRVILSLGGAVEYSNVTISTHDLNEAERIAGMLWNLFLGGKKLSDIRPFGSIKLDGIDFDNETKDMTGYDKLASSLRSFFKEDSSKSYYLSMTPQCPDLEGVANLSKIYRFLDYVAVQFYNTESCDLDRPDFLKSLWYWGHAISTAQLFIGVMAKQAENVTGYLDANRLLARMEYVHALNLTNLAGIAIWDAQLATDNNNFQTIVSNGLSKP